MKTKLLLAFLLLIAAPLFAEVQLAKIFGDNMVLQREVKLNIWGSASPNETIQLTFRGKRYKTVADENGAWRCVLPKLRAGRGEELVITGKTIAGKTITGTNKLVLKNVAVGDVWLCGGQSNMEWHVSSRIDNMGAEIAAASYPDIRLIDVENQIGFEPKADIQTGGWKICSPQTVGAFSAVGYFFARELTLKHRVPIGLIASNWGGTVAEAWMSESAIHAFGEFENELTTFKRTAQNPDSAQRVAAAQEQRWREAFEKMDQGLSASPAWSAETLRDADWKTIPIPSLWENTVLPDFDGVVWLRKEVDISESDVGKPATLSLGKIDDADETYINGKRIGGIHQWNADRRYEVSAGVLKSGKNTIAVRVLDTGGGGGLYSDAAEINLTVGGTTVPLSGTWKYRVAMNLADAPKRLPNPLGANQPTALFNAMIAPLTKFSIKGVIWYQGESNAGRAAQYRRLFPSLIRDWRAQFGYDFPFCFVQLALYKTLSSEPPSDEKPDDWAELREAQTLALALPKTAMAVTMDIGDAKDIHPRNKQDVGKRLALAADTVAYGEVAKLSPVYQSMRVEGNKIRVSFRYAASGLAMRGETPNGFAICGADKKFVWANARIENGDVVVWSEQVASPVAVRYAWASNPGDVVLFSNDGLPVAPFRTDDVLGK
jgi:sialate O-acetylesterase